MYRYCQIKAIYITDEVASVVYIDGNGTEYRMRMIGINHQKVKQFTKLAF